MKDDVMVVTMGNMWAPKTAESKVSRSAEQLAIVSADRKEEPKAAKTAATMAAPTALR